MLWEQIIYRKTTCSAAGAKKGPENFWKTAAWQILIPSGFGGGGFYSDDWFFDLCDELGLVVWQDFMFACSVYELTEEFEANIRQEFIDNIKRIRHHACLGLWCGNNEMEMFVEERCWVTKYSEVRDYLFMYERILPEILKKYDPETFYWPASPSSGGSFDHPNDPDRGDVHYWKVWHGNRPFAEYRKHFFRYLSEFGFQAFPAKKGSSAYFGIYTLGRYISFASNN